MECFLRQSVVHGGVLGTRDAHGNGNPRTQAMGNFDCMRLGEKGNVKAVPEHFYGTAGFHFYRASAQRNHGILQKLSEGRCNFRTDSPANFWQMILLRVLRILVWPHIST